MKRLLVAIAIIAVGLFGTSGTANAQTFQQTFVVFCTGTGQVCEPKFVAPINVPTKSNLIIDFTVLDTYCSSTLLAVAAAGQSKTVQLGYPGGPGPLTTGPLDFGTVSPGGYEVTLQSTGIVSGCNEGQLFSWGGTLTITLDEPCLIPSALQPAVACADCKAVSVEFEKLNEPTGGDLEDLASGLPAELGSGKRIFPDADLSDLNKPKREVTVKVKVAPAQGCVDVFVRSFDVDDSSGLFVGGSGGDNLGPSARQNDQVPGQGAFRKVGSNQIESQPVKLRTNQNGEAKIIFRVTMQPGDNFKVAASVKKGLLDNATVVKGPNDGAANNVQLAQSIKDSAGKILPEANAEAVTSKLLTVWRKLHVEVDSISAPPASDTDPERNFIKGNIIGIESSQLAGQGRVATKLILEPMSPPLVNGLRDGSPDLDGKATPNFAKGEVSMGKGRFENGTITVGTNSPITALDGNGQFFVQKETGINIAFSLADDNNQNMISGSITELDSKKKEFTLNQKLKGDAKGYADGKLTVAGMTFTVAKVNGFKVEIVEDNKLPFLLADDDKKQPPFLQKPTTAENGDATGFLLMQNSEDQNLNLYAAAYIQPVYDLPSDINVGFFRNFIDDDNVALAQFSKGQTFTSTPDFFVVYVQAAFQGPTFIPVANGRSIGDGDPDNEGNFNDGNSIGLGITITKRENGTLKGGSFVFRESLLEVVRIRKIVEFLCLDFTVVHETGHQWGLKDRSGGIMNQGCGDEVMPMFKPEHLRIIRTSPFPQGE